MNRSIDPPKPPKRPKLSAPASHQKWPAKLVQSLDGGLPIPDTPWVRTRSSQNTLFYNSYLDLFGLRNLFQTSSWPAPHSASENDPPAPPESTRTVSRAFGARGTWEASYTGDYDKLQERRQRR